MLARGGISTAEVRSNDRIAQDFENGVRTGFSLGTSKGPLCAEPVEGVSYFVESLRYDTQMVEAEKGEDLASYGMNKVLTSLSLVQNTMPQVIGSLITAVQDACRNGLLDWSPRLKLAMYTCDIQASSTSEPLHQRSLNRIDVTITADVLGKVYGVVSRRRGRIVSEEMKEGTSFFTVTAMLPVVESFGFADGEHDATYPNS